MALAAAAAAVVVAGAPAASGRADGSGLRRVQCLAAAAGCARPLAVARPSGVVAYGGTVYVRSGVGSLGSLGVFARDVRTGRLRQLQCVARNARRCADGRGLETPSALAVSTDGRSVYVAAANGRAVGVYRRARDGRLSSRGSVARLSRPRALAVSPDGRNVYVGGDRLWTFRRAASGALTLAGSVAQQVAAVAVSRDGSTVYAAGGGGRRGTLVAYAREPGSGVLTPQTELSAPAEPGLQQPVALVATRDAVFLLATVSGALTRYDTTLRRTALLRGFPAASGLAAADGRLYVAHRRGIAVLTPQLRRLGTVALLRAGGVAAAGRGVYAVSPGRITVFARAASR